MLGNAIDDYMTTMGYSRDEATAAAKIGLKAAPDTFVLPDEVYVGHLLHVRAKQLVAVVSQHKSASRNAATTTGMLRKGDDNNDGIDDDKPLSRSEATVRQDFSNMHSDGSEPQGEDEIQHFPLWTSTNDDLQYPQFGIASNDDNDGDFNKIANEFEIASRDWLSSGDLMSSADVEQLMNS